MTGHLDTASAANRLKIVNAVTATLSVPNIASTLAKIPFLVGVPAPKLEELVQTSFLRRYKDGDKIIHQGEYGHTLFALLQGAVQIEAAIDNGQVRKLARFDEAGQYFGELAILGRTRRTATALSVGDSVLLEIEKTKIERLDKESGNVLAGIEQLSQRRAINTFLTQHRAFSELKEDELKIIVNTSTLSVHQRGTTIFAEKDLAKEILIIKSGVAKLVKEEAGGLAVLAYFNTGDVVGLWDGIRRVASLVSMGYVEVIRAPRLDFERLKDVRPGFFDQFHKADLARSTRLSGLAERARSTPVAAGAAPENADGGGGDTVYQFVDQLVLEGAQEAQSLLTIDLNACVRCGNCVRACEDRHGHARMTRRGKKLVRRQKIEEAGKYQTLLLPSSCRHCVNPECMIGCPTGAIHRMATGEVDVHSFCIGCGNCANRCPWDNIQMVPSPGRLVNGAEMKLMATKCNLCAGYEYSNCVNNCPTGAILRIEPNTYFEEVQQLLGTGNQKAVGGRRTESKQKFDLTKVLFPLGALIIAAGFALLVATSPTPLVTFSPQGFALGFAAIGCMIGALSLAGRRKLARFKTQLGTFQVWTRAHVYFGGLALLAVLLHSGLRLGGVITAMLLISVLIEVCTGVFGVIFYKSLPKVITRIERESQVEEDLLEERRTLRRRRTEILADASVPLASVVEQIGRHVGSTLSRYGRRYDNARAQAQILERLSASLATLAVDDARKVERLITDGVRSQEIAAALWLYRVRRGWLVTHIGVTAILATLVVVHVVSVLYF